MHKKRNLFFILILVLIILSISFVSASENITSDTNDDATLSVADDVAVEENDVENSVDESPEPVLGVSRDDQSDVNESVVNLTKTNAQVLGVANDEPVLGVEYHASSSGINTRADLIYFAQNHQGTQSQPNIIFLDGKTLEAGYGSNNFGIISNVYIYGGSSTTDSTMAYFDFDGTALYADGLDNVQFHNLKAKDRLFWFSTSNPMTNVVIDNCECVNQFMWIAGDGNGPKPVLYCNFTNCRQTYGVNDPENEYYDGNGQLGAVSGATIDHCNFISTSSGHHGGALCIADESNWGPTQNVPDQYGNPTSGLVSSVKNTNFINITSRWFAVYLHGNFSKSPGHYIDSPEIIDNCKFINCIASGEYSGALGISHNKVQVKNCEFINCSGGQGSAIMVGGIDGDHDAFNGRNYQANEVLIENCNFTNNVATLEKGSTHCTGWMKLGWGDIRDTSKYTYHLYPDGPVDNTNGEWFKKHNDSYYYPSGDAGAIYVVGNDTQILNCIFDSNMAESGNGSAVYILGERTIIKNTEFYNHDAFNGTVFIKGNDAKIKDTTFINNNATNGAAIFIQGNGANIINSVLNNNTATNGTIYVKGSDTVVSESTLKFNNATNGAGIFIKGAGSTISKSNFTNNTVTYHGGAVYIDGSNTKFENNNFINNTAIANDTFSKLSGLGGAIYVKGQNTISIGNNFEHNVARNGSAYYADGSLSIKNDTFKENQAWSYLLITVAEPEESYYNTNDVRIKVVHVGGDNVLNAIHCNAPANQILLNNVTYIHSNPEIGQVTTPNEDLHPVEGVENSNKGQLVYKDDREWYQLLRINVTWVSANVPNRALLGSNSNRGPNRQGTGIISEDPFKYYSGDIHTNLYGDVYITLPKDKLKVGEYLVEAEHPEDWNYKQILNTTKFRILPQVDLSVVKTCSNLTFFDDDIAVWTITVSNAFNATNATNVVVTDILPSEFVFINYTATNNTVYDNKTGEWKIPKMENGTSETLIINSYAKSYIDRMNHFVNVESREDQIDITFTRTSDKDTYLTDDVAVWTVTVTNNGDVGATDVNLTNLLPFEFANATGDGNYDEDNNTWVVGNLPAHNTVTLTINSRAVTDVSSITNLMYLDYKEKHIKFNATKTGDKDQYQVGEDAVCTVTVKNIGTCPATYVVLRDILQPEFAYSSQNPSIGNYLPDENMWVIDSLNVDEEATLTINCKAQRVSGNVTNYAVITGDQHDWDETNNIASANATVIPLPHPVKNVNNITPYYNDIIEYNLTIVNTGNVTYRNNLTVIDELPDELKYNSTYKISRRKL